MDEISVDIKNTILKNIEEDIESIKNLLKEWQNDNGIQKEVEGLKKQLYNKNVAQSHFHASYFKFLNNIAPDYLSVENDFLLSLYNSSNRLLDKLLNRSSIGYAFYYLNEDGSTGRAELKEIPEDALIIERNELRINANAIESLLREKNIKNSLFSKHYQYFEKKATEYLKNPSSSFYRGVNKGHIAEAFERHYQLSHVNENDLYSDNFDKQDIGTLLWLSKGNKPWYAGGDVGSTQVKSILSFGNFRNIRLTSKNSIEDIVNFLIYLAQPGDLTEQAYSILRVLKREDYLGHFTKDTSRKMEKMIENHFLQNKIKS